MGSVMMRLGSYSTLGHSYVPQSFYTSASRTHYRDQKPQSTATYFYSASFRFTGNEPLQSVSIKTQEITPANLDRFLIGTSPAMQQVRKTIQKVAPTTATILILGETGTGKELVAKAIHGLSPRKKLKALNCAAFPEGLLESELFGHEKGSFSGAAGQRIGIFEQASGGTLFLDEVGDMSTKCQSDLLRTLQERTIKRVGGNDEIPVDVRVITATKQDLPKMVDEKKFRDDLFFRLNVFPIRVPPLRERQEDIPLLANHFLAKFSERYGKPFPGGFSEEALHTLKNAPWPGNIRELENVIERAVINGEESAIQATDLGISPPSAKPMNLDNLTPDTRNGVLAQVLAAFGDLTWDKLHALVYQTVLQQRHQLCGGVITATAKNMGLWDDKVRLDLLRINRSQDEAAPADTEEQLHHAVSEFIDGPLPPLRDLVAKTYLLHALKQNDFKVPKAATKSGLAVMTFYRELSRLGIGLPTELKGKTNALQADPAIPIPPIEARLESLKQAVEHLDTKPLTTVVDLASKSYLEQLLKRHDYRINNMIEDSGLTRSALYREVKRLGIQSKPTN